MVRTQLNFGPRGSLRSRCLACAGSWAHLHSLNRVSWFTLTGGALTGEHVLLDPDSLVSLVEEDTADGRWVITAGHDVGDGGGQTVLVHALDALCRRASQADVWVAPAAEVAGRLRRLRNGT
jgi:hypothetical protein